MRQLQQRLDTAPLEDWLMPVNQFAGVHINLPQLVPQLPFTTVKDYEDYRVRLTKVPVVFDQTIALMRRGIERHLVPPRFLPARSRDDSICWSSGSTRGSRRARPRRSAERRFVARRFAPIRGVRAVTITSRVSVKAETARGPAVVC